MARHLPEKKSSLGFVTGVNLVFVVRWLGAHFISMEATRAAVGCIQGGEVVRGSEPLWDALAPLPHGILALLPRADEENPQGGSEMHPPRAVPSAAPQHWESRRSLLISGGGG